MTPQELVEVRDRLAVFAAEVFAPLGRSDLLAPSYPDVADGTVSAPC
jgi:hypothetical protein